MKYGLQLYSIRDITPHDMAGALKEVRAMGYESVEPAGFFGISAKDFKAMLDDHGLEISSTHTGWQEPWEHFAETVEYHRTIGNNFIIIPGADLSDREKLFSFVKTVNDLQPRLLKEGIRLGYHNHSHEFRPNADGSLIYETLLRETELYLEIDTYWAWNAGKDPVAMMNRFHSPVELNDRFAERLPVIHIKDGVENGEGRTLGKGSAPVKAVWETAKKMGIHMVVESETLQPDGLTEARECIKYLKELEGK